MTAWIWIGIFFVTGTAAQAGPSEVVDELLGRWQMYELVLDGERRPPFNPDLVLEFTFAADGTDILRWTRNGESGFCERRGEYKFDGQNLEDKVVWVHPDNRAECALDPDMQQGRVTVTPAWIEDGNFWTEFVVGDHQMIYIWRRVPARPTSVRP